MDFDNLRMQLDTSRQRLVGLQIYIVACYGSTSRPAMQIKQMICEFEKLCEEIDTTPIAQTGH
jgi:hypothetical protein